MNRKTVLIPFLLVGPFAGAGRSAPVDSARIVILSDRVGPVVSADERQRYHLFTQFKDFSRAVVLQLPDSSCAIRFTLVSSGGLRDTLVRYSWTAIMLMADRIEHFEELENGEYVLGSSPPALKYSSPGPAGSTEFVPRGVRMAPESVLSWQEAGEQGPDGSLPFRAVSGTPRGDESLPFAPAIDHHMPRYYPSLALGIGLRTLSPDLSGLTAATGTPAISEGILLDFLPELLVTREIGVQVDLGFGRGPTYTSGATIVLYAHPFENPDLRPFLELGGVWTFITGDLGSGPQNGHMGYFGTAGGGVRAGAGIEYLSAEGPGIALDVSYEHIARKSDLFYDWGDWTGSGESYRVVPVSVDLSSFRFGIRVKFQ
jgi:hypothetical protein